MRLTKAALLVMWTMFLSAMTALLSAAPLRVFRITVGNGFYWAVMALLLSVLVSLGWIPFAAVLGIQTLVIGIYSELEERDFNLNQATTLSVFLTALILGSVFYVWAALTGKGWYGQIHTIVSDILARAAELKLPIVSSIKTEEIIFQIPSAVFIFLILSLAISLMLERPFLKWAGAKGLRTDKLSDFTVPDFFVWLFILSLLGTFGNHGNHGLEAASLNVLNVTATVYFFQGLAVLFNYFESFSVGLVWRMLWIIFVVIQLPILLGLLGLVDYWANFRKAIAKRASNAKKRRIQE